MITELITNKIIHICNSVCVYTSTHTCYMGQHSCGYPTAHPLNGNTPTIPNPSVVVGVDGFSTPPFPMPWNHRDSGVHDHKGHILARELDGKLFGRERPSTLNAARWHAGSASKAGFKLKQHLVNTSFRRRCGGMFLFCMWRDLDLNGYGSIGDDLSKPLMTIFHVQCNLIKVTRIVMYSIHAYIQLYNSRHDM